MCKKREYPDRKEARKAAFEMSRRTGEVLKEYRCPFCHAWNIGHRARMQTKSWHRLVAQRDAHG